MNQTPNPQPIMAVIRPNVLDHSKDYAIPLTLAKQLHERGQLRFDKNDEVYTQVPGVPLPDPDQLKPAPTRHDLIQARGSFVTCNALMDDPASIMVHVLKGQGDETYSSYSGHCFPKHACWPVEAQAELTAILTERARLKQAYVASLRLVDLLAAKFPEEG